MLTDTSTFQHLQQERFIHQWGLSSTMLTLILTLLKCHFRLRQPKGL